MANYNKRNDNQNQNRTMTSEAGRAQNEKSSNTSHECRSECKEQHKGSDKSGYSCSK